VTSSSFFGPESAAAPAAGSRGAVLLICALLALAVALVFCQTGRHEFVNFDDDRYVYDNEQVKAGLAPSNLGYYLIHRHSYTYHPVTSFSHMLDCQLFGAKADSAGGHHWMNVVLHAAVAIGLFLLLRLMTGRLWPAALVAAVFAIHPLRVESVAWISERRDVLSGLFLVLTLGAYVYYTRRPRDLRRYVAVCALFALGLLAKPMLVTLPVVLLLLDYWPLGRWRGDADDRETLECDGLPTLSITLENERPEDGEGDLDSTENELLAGMKSDGEPSYSKGPGNAVAIAPDPVVAGPRKARWRFPWPLLTEKVPLLVLALLDGLITVYTQNDGGALQPAEVVSWPARFANLPIAYANYIGSFFWPQGLAVLYPHPCGNVDFHDAAIKGCLLAGVSAAVALLWRRMPYLLVGWLWYLLMLLPVIGLLQVGGQSMADRYTYLPQIGLAMAVVWAVVAAAKRSVAFRSAKERNFRGAKGDNTILRPCGRVLLALASVGILAAIAAAAWRQTAYWHDSKTLWARELSFPEYNNVVAHYDYGLALAEDGRHREAVEQYQAALARDSTDEASRLNLGLSYEALGSANAALQEYRTIVKDNPKSVSGQNNLARLLQDRDNDREAVEHLRIAHKEEPSNYGMCSRLANLLATSPDKSLRDGAEALRLARRAVKLSGGKDAAALDARAAAEAETGDFAAAKADAQAALKLAVANGETKLAGEIRVRLDLYRAGKPFRAKPGTKAKPT
jgi:tetratricopeptide (TPR) repeat protein